MGMGMVLWEWEGMGTEIVLPAHLYCALSAVARVDLINTRPTQIGSIQQQPAMIRHAFRYAHRTQWTGIDTEIPTISICCGLGVQLVVDLL